MSLCDCVSFKGRLFYGKDVNAQNCVKVSVFPFFDDKSGGIFVIFYQRLKEQMRLLTLITLAFLLSGCANMFFGQKTISQICKEYPQMCNDLNSDAHCRREKAEIIRTRYANRQAPSDPLKFDLLMQFEDYQECIGKAAQIEHIKHKEKKTDRVKGVITARRQLAQLARDTEDSKYPYLLHYHWSRFGRQESLREYLVLEKAGKLEEPELQVFLAEFYVKRDLDKTVRILYRALELYESGDEVNPEIFYSLSTIFLKQERFPRAYVWAYIAKEYDVDNLDLTAIEALVRQVGKRPSRLEDIGDDYMSDIRSGDFVAPEHKPFVYN
jgi:hypothetical protein